LFDYGEDGKLLAGGTDLLSRMKYGLALPRKLISLRKITPRDPIATKDHLELDALMPLADVVRSELIAQWAPLLVEAAQCVGSNQIRHMGTLGGNICLEPRCQFFNQSHSHQYTEPCFKRNGERCYLIPKGKKCWAVFMADTVPALISLGASLKIMSVAGIRITSLEALYTGDPLKPFNLSQGEFITGLRIPIPPQLDGTAFVKVSVRGGLEFAALSVGVSLEMTLHDATCRSAKITVGSIASAPLQTRKAEAFMAGQPLSADVFQEASKIIASEVRPFSHHGYSTAYLKYAVEIYSRRALALAAERVVTH
jgi:CO/xanthine dehydrogenase FAD-binding subunit